jgi:hypothetical protein
MLIMRNDGQELCWQESLSFGRPAESAAFYAQPSVKDRRARLFDGVGLALRAGNYNEHTSLNLLETRSTFHRRSVHSQNFLCI